MLQTTLLPLQLLQLTSKVVNSEIVTPEQASLVFSGPKFLVALIAGVLMAFAFQLLLTNLTVAIGISGGVNPADDDTESLGSQIRAVENKVGIWAVFTATIALFAASFLAVKLSIVESPLLGGIIGVVIWSAFFTLIVWLGSSAVGSLLGSFASTVSSSFQGLMGTASTAMGANAARKQMVSTAEDITAAVRRELTSGFDAEAISNTLQSSLNLPKLDLQNIRQQFDQLLKDVDLESVADSDLVKNINRQTFVDLISSRTDFSKSEINQIADQLESAWKGVLNRQNPTEKVINLLQSATPEELNSENLSERLQQLVTSGNGKSTNGALKQTVQSAARGATSAVLEKVDVSQVNLENLTQQLQKLKEKVQDVDVEKITSQLQQLQGKASEQVKNLPLLSNNSLSGNTIKQDIEEYIKYSLPWHFNRLSVQDEFREVIYDPDANPGSIRRQLESLNQEYFTNLLQQRGDLSEARIKEISEQLASVRQEVFDMVKQAEARSQSNELRTRISDYLRSTGKEELNPEGIERDLTQLLEEPEVGIENLSERISEIDRDTLLALLQQRQDISPEEANNIVTQIENVRDTVVNRARELQDRLQSQAQELRQQVEDYLRNTNLDELNPESIERDFRTLLDDPQAGFSALRARISQFDRETLVKLLSQRQDVNEEQINRIIDNLESVRDSILIAPQKVADNAKQRYEQTISAISEYLRQTNLEELDPQGIQNDLQKLLEDPQEGAVALRERLSQVDRETIVKLLSQQGNLSEEQINQKIDQIQDAIAGILKAPRRLANRSVKQAINFEASLENYLRNTNKEELNPDSIKRDLQLLINSPRAGIGNFAERISKFDRSTLIALLSQRSDISEEEANRIVDQILSVRDSLAEQYQKLQQRVQSTLDGIFGNVRTYLNSLNRPELNYENIQQDFAKLFDDPQAGFEAIKNRLSQFDRDTLVAIISSREDISQEQANQIVNRIEVARDSVLHRTERIQQEVNKRLDAIKEKTKASAVETRKAVASAAWWLFNTAFISLAASAFAGVLAVDGLKLFGY